VARQKILTDVELYNSWCIDIDRLTEQAVILNNNCSALKKLIECEKHPQKSRLSLDTTRWVGHTFALAICIQLRAFCDSQDNTNSLRLLLNDMGKSPHLLFPLNAFASRRDPTNPELTALWQEYFDGDCSLAGITHKIATLLKMLPSKTSLFKFINMTIAHQSKESMEKPPTYGELLQNCTSVIETTLLLDKILRDSHFEMPKEQVDNPFLR